MNQRQYLLESYDQATQVRHLVQFLSGNYRVGQDAQNIYGRYMPVMGVLQDVFLAVPVFTYDWDELENRYPIAFHTENAILISSKVVNDYFTHDDRDIHYRWVPAKIAHMLLDMIENRYDYVLTTEQRQQLMALAQSSYFRFDTSSVEHEKIKFFSWKDIDLLALDKGLKMDNYASKMGVDSKALDTVLANLVIEPNDKSHPLAQLVKQCQDKEQLDLPSYDVSMDEYQKHYKGEVNANSNAYALHVINHKIKALVSDAQEENLMPEQILPKIKTNLVPFLLNTNPDTFAAGLERLLLSFNRAGINKMLNNENVEKIGILMSEHDNFCASKKFILINTLSGAWNIKQQVPKKTYYY